MPSSPAIGGGAPAAARRRDLREIAAAGGGIVSTVTATRAATEDELVAQARARLDEMLACGTTTCEIKSGYGLDLESELKMLRVDSTARRVAADRPRRDVHGRARGPARVPRDRARYVDLVVDEMIPAVAAAGLAEWCDVFCETGVFTPEESQTHPRGGPARRPEAAHPRRRARRERRIAGRRRGRRALRRPPHLRAARRHRGDGASRRRRDAAADARRSTSSSGASRRRARSSTPASRSRSPPTSTPAAASRRRCRSR